MSAMLRKIVFALLMFVFPVLTIGAAGRTFTLVIDAGHGGHDSGARGAVSAEKNLTLRYALAFGKAVEQNCSDVKVIYTRKTDVFLPLHERADIANRNKADLFISIHINALEPGHISRGFQSYTLGTGERTGDRGLKENLEGARRENSVIFMEKDYQSNYKGLANSAESDIMFEFIADKNRERSVELSRMMQQEVCKATGRHDGGSHQNNLAVLRLTSMPAALLELGFISTPDEETFLNTDSALDLYTNGMLKAFIRYKRKYGAIGNDDIDVPYRQNQTRDTSALTDSDENATDNDEASSSSSHKRKGNKIGTRSTRSRETTQREQADKAESSSKRSSQNRIASARNIESDKRQTADNKVVKQSEPVFKVQIFSSTVKVKAGSPLFKGLEGCESYEEGSYTKYTYGSSNNYNSINRLRKSILDKFPQAFVIAFKDGKKMNVNEGIKEFLRNKHSNGNR